MVAQAAAPLGAEAPSPAREAEVLALTLRLLAGPAPHEELAARLAADPPLLAACFGNVDLLYSAPFAAADAVSAYILQAVERLEPEG